MRALRLVVEELLRPLFNTENLTSYHNLETVLEDVAHDSRTAKFSRLSDKTSFHNDGVCKGSEGEADWPFHILALKFMMPYFFAAGHINYVRYTIYYLISMVRLPNLVLKHFMQGKHVIKHIPEEWNVIWSDMFIETSFMRYGHSKLGINGLTLKNSK